MLQAIYVFLIEFDLPLYFIGGVGLFISLWNLIRSQTILRYAVFTLERERGQQLQANAVLGTAMLSALLGAVLYVNAVVAPTLPAELFIQPTPTINLYRTPLSSPTPLSTIEIGTPRPRVTPDLVPTVTMSGISPSATGNPTPPPAVNNTEAGSNSEFAPAADGCTAGINISDPRPGATVGGTVSFRGSATDDNFGFYAIEIRGESTGSRWVDILGSQPTTPVTDGLLGAADLTILPAGVYEVRLAVFAPSGAPAGQCLFALNIAN